MELGKQIKKYRTERAWSQDVLSEKVYVSRQTISNWENDKSYPDVKSLVLLSEVFGVTLDQLIKGDIETMKQQIDQSDKDRFERLSWMLTVLFVLDILTPIPLAHFLSHIGERDYKNRCKQNRSLSGHTHRVAAKAAGEGETCR